MGNIIAIALLIIIVGSACFHIWRQKGRGGCIGCPCSGGASCHCRENDR